MNVDYNKYYTTLVETDEKKLILLISLNISNAKHWLLHRRVFTSIDTTYALLYYIVINTPCNKINQRTLDVRKINQLGPYQNCPKFYERIGFSVLV